LWKEIRRFLKAQDRTAMWSSDTARGHIPKEMWVRIQ
jgi:hypothetical protein